MFRSLLLVFTAASLFGQPLPERVLVPIAIEGQIAGAGGSLWETRLSIR